MQKRDIPDYIKKFNTYPTKMLIKLLSIVQSSFHKKLYFFEVIISTYTFEYRYCYCFKKAVKNESTHKINISNQWANSIL